jgi:AcrR family transcriptional regulator
MAKLPVKRPGGRSSRITQAVFDAVESLLAEAPSEIPSMTVIAQRAEVNPTTLYRRWTDARELVGAVAVSRLMRDNPVQDTGSVRGDLIRWGNSVARSLGTRRNITLLRILTATPTPGAAVSDMRSLRELPIGRRIVELETVLARGKKRGEITPKVMDVLELVLAPIYLHGFFLGPLRDASVDRLVDRALALASDK